MTVHVRSYTRDISNRLSHLVSVDTIGVVGGLPMFYRKIGTGDKHVLITGGVHGDEPAGTLAALELMFHKPIDGFTLHIYPSLNPTGYEAHRRESSEGKDLNRAFDETIVIQEACLFSKHVIKQVIQHRVEYLFCMDLHEDNPEEDGEEPGLLTRLWRAAIESDKKYTKDNADGVYLYEICPDKSIRMGRRMIDAVALSPSKVCTKPVLYGNDVCIDGLVSYPEANKSAEYAKGNSVDAWLTNYCPQTFTTETLTNCCLEYRIRDQLTMFEMAIACKS